MLLGFISLLLTVGQSTILKICISKSVGDSWHPCDRHDEEAKYGADGSSDGGDDGGDEGGGRRRRLLHAFIDEYSGGSHRRVLAGGGTDKCAEEARVTYMHDDVLFALHIHAYLNLYEYKLIRYHYHFLLKYPKKNTYIFLEI